jgi:tetratricopeptide (TPR) repeat protein
MPLPGGASDKAGNRYELLWTVDRLVDIVLGQATSIRLEPPGLDGIEFHYSVDATVEFHQVKRGNASEGRWSISRLKPVLKTFKKHLLADERVTCVFVSGDGVLALGELAERACSANSHDEYDGWFLKAETHKRAYEDLCSTWELTSEESWLCLQRLRIETIAESQLRSKLDQVLRLLFTAPPSSTRAALCQLVLEQVHGTLNAPQILDYLERSDIRRVPIAPVSGAREFFKPPAPRDLVGRNSTIENCVERLRENFTLILVGPSGIGKSSIAAQICSEAQFADVAWIDCSTMTSVRSGLSTLDALAEGYSDASMRELLRQPHASPQTIGRVIGNFLSRHRLLLVWDALGLADEDVTILEAIGAQLRNGAQIITSTNVRAVERLGWGSLCELPPLNETAAIELFRALAGHRPNQDILRLVNGHPYLIQLAALAMERLTESDTGIVVREKAGAWLASRILDILEPLQRDILERCSVYRTGFQADWVAENDVEHRCVRSLAMSHLLVSAQNNRYAVHEMIRGLIEQGLLDIRKKQFHRSAAAQMTPHDRFTIDQLREYSYHATQADLASEAQRVLVALVSHAVENGFWGQVLEITASLSEQEVGGSWSFIWYQRGRGLRLMGATAEALDCYRRAQISSPADLANSSRFEEASMLTYLDRPEEAKRIYQELVEDGVTHPSVQAMVSLALLVFREENGYEEAQTLLSRALDVGQREGYWHATLQAEQVWGRVALEHDHLDEAHTHLVAAYTARMEHAEEIALQDIIGWHDLYRCLVEVETRRRHRPGAIGAARGLLKFSHLSKNPIWVAEATYQYCAAIDDDSDADARAAIHALGALLRRATSEQPLEVIAGYLAAALWCLGDWEVALRTLLELDEEGEELVVPIIFSLASTQDDEVDDHLPRNWLSALPAPLRLGWIFGVNEWERLKEVLTTLSNDFPTSTRIMMEAIRVEDGQAS